MQRSHYWPWSDAGPTAKRLIDLCGGQDWKEGEDWRCRHDSAGARHIGSVGPCQQCGGLAGHWAVSSLLREPEPMVRPASRPWQRWKEAGIKGCLALWESPQAVPIWTQNSHKKHACNHDGIKIDIWRHHCMSREAGSHWDNCGLQDQLKCFTISMHLRNLDLWSRRVLNVHN